MGPKWKGGGGSGKKLEYENLGIFKNTVHFTTFWVKSRLGFNKFCSKWGILFWQNVDFEGNFNFKKTIEFIWVKTTYLDIFPGEKKIGQNRPKFFGVNDFGEKMRQIIKNLLKKFNEDFFLAKSRFWRQF